MPRDVRRSKRLSNIKIPSVPEDATRRHGDSARRQQQPVNHADSAGALAFIAFVVGDHESMRVARTVSSATDQAAP